ncbi:inorganic phosphate transporter [SAR202 cluster bacterium AD-802-E10_MRT_200m]|nr:inorganic phosphate transporter [SAR202 cluster bacterium AD-802-E10_MRT_200m]
MADQATILLAFTLFMALAYAYSNGLNDAANALATVVSTRAMTPVAAVIMGGAMNLLGALTGTAVAKTIGKGIVDPDYMTQAAVLSAILAAVAWVITATRFGLPVSVSHSLVAGVLGAGISTAGLEQVNETVMTKVLMALAFSPFLGFLGAFVFMVLLYWLLRHGTLSTVNAIFIKLQILSAALLSYSHGKNDAQNAIGIMALGWAVYYSNDVTVEVWMQITAGVAIGIGTALGGWRVIRTLGSRITRLEPTNGFIANIAAATVIEAASNIGLPVSTTHTASSAIMGVGATRGLSAISLNVIRGIFAAWLVTYPVCLGLAFVFVKIFQIILSS